MTLITDELPAYHDAYKKEFWTLRNPRTELLYAKTIKENRSVLKDESP